jgi:hypothetical protein
MLLFIKQNSHAEDLSARAINCKYVIVQEMGVKSHVVRLWFLGSEIRVQA